MIFFLLPLLLALLILLHLLGQEVLSTHHLKVFLARQLLGWEGRVLLLLALVLDCFALNILLLKLGQESLPVLILHVRILGQFFLYH